MIVTGKDAIDRGDGQASVLESAAEGLQLERDTRPGQVSSLFGQVDADYGGTPMGQRHPANLQAFLSGEGGSAARTLASRRSGKSDEEMLINVSI
jgi:hypothetical protein